MKVITALSVAGLPVMRINAKRVREFARAQGMLAKTDAYAGCSHGCGGFPTSSGQRLATWVGGQPQLTTFRAIERTRLHQTREAELRASIEPMIDLLSEERDQLDRQSD